MFNILAGGACTTALGADPGLLPVITSTLITIIKIAIPVLLVILGMLDLSKAVMSGDEKVVKENQGKLIKRFVYAIVIFVLVSLVTLVFSIIGRKSAENDKTAKNNVVDCIPCFVSNTGC